MRDRHDALHLVCLAGAYLLVRSEVRAGGTAWVRHVRLPASFRSGLLALRDSGSEALLSGADGQLALLCLRGPQQAQLALVRQPPGRPLSALLFFSGQYCHAALYAVSGATGVQACVLRPRRRALRHAPSRAQVRVPPLPRTGEEVLVCRVRGGGSVQRLELLRPRGEGGPVYLLVQTGASVQRVLLEDPEVAFCALRPATGGGAAAEGEELARGYVRLWPGWSRRGDLLAQLGQQGLEIYPADAVSRPRAHPLFLLRQVPPAARLLAALYAEQLTFLVWGEEARVWILSNHHAQAAAASTAAGPRLPAALLQEVALEAPALGCALLPARRGEQLASLVVWTRSGVQMVRARMSGEALFAELLAQGRERSEGEFLGKALQLDLLGLYERAADRALAQGQLARADQLYRMSHAPHSKLIRTFLQQDRLDIVLATLRALLQPLLSAAPDSSPAAAATTTTAAAPAAPVALHLAKSEAARLALVLLRCSLQQALMQHRGGTAEDAGPLDAALMRLVTGPAAGLPGVPGAALLWLLAAGPAGLPYLSALCTAHGLAAGALQVLGKRGCFALAEAECAALLQAAGPEAALNSPLLRAASPRSQAALLMQLRLRAPVFRALRRLLPLLPPALLDALLQHLLRESLQDLVPSLSAVPATSSASSPLPHAASSFASGGGSSARSLSSAELDTPPLQQLAEMFLEGIARRVSLLPATQVEDGEEHAAGALRALHRMYRPWVVYWRLRDRPGCERLACLLLELQDAPLAALRARLALLPATGLGAELVRLARAPGTEPAQLLLAYLERGAARPELLESSTLQEPRLLASLAALVEAGRLPSGCEWLAWSVARAWVQQQATGAASGGTLGASRERLLQEIRANLTKELETRERALLPLLRASDADLVVFTCGHAPARRQLLEVQLGELKARLGAHLPPLTLRSILAEYRLRRPSLACPRCLHSALTALYRLNGVPDWTN